MIKAAALRLERLAVFLYLAVFAGAFWPPDSYLARHELPKGGSNLYDFTCFVSLAAVLAVALAARWREALRLLRGAWPVLALVGLAFLSAFWSDAPLLVIRRSGTVALTTLFGIYLCARGELGELVATLTKVYVAAMAASLVLVVAAPSVAIGGNETYVHAWRGAFTDKNTLGLACALTMIVSVYAFRGRYGPRAIAVAGMLLSLVLLKLSESKTPVAVMAVALYAAVLAAVLRRRSGAGLASGFVLAVVGLAGAAVIALDLSDVLAMLGRDPTFTNRAKIWHYALAYIARRPWLGYGFGAFWRADGVEANQVWALIEFQTPHAHNAWLELGLALGLVGLFLAALAWLAGFYRVLRVLTAPAGRHAAFCFALLAGVFIENLTEYEFFRPGDMLWVLFVVALTHLGQARLAERRRRQEAAALAAYPAGALRRGAAARAAAIAS